MWKKVKTKNDGGELVWDIVDEVEDGFTHIAECSSVKTDPAGAVADKILNAVNGTPKRVYVANRVEYDDSSDQIIGVWDDQDNLMNGLKDLNTWTSDVWMDGQWVIAKERDTGEVSSLAYVTCALVQ